MNFVSSFSLILFLYYFKVYIFREEEASKD